MRLTLIVGVGGVGIDALKQVKSEICRSFNGKPEDVEYLAIDTDSHIRDEFENEEAIHLVIPSMMVVAAPSYLPNYIRDFMHPELMGMDPEGAGGIRQVGRFKMYFNHEMIYGRMREKIQKLTKGNPHAKVQVMIVSGTAGGTGSGCVLDIAYMIRSVLAGMHLPDSKILAYLTLPDVSGSKAPFPPHIAQYLQANGFAFMKELEYLMSIHERDGEVVEAYIQDNPEHKSKEKPFDFVYLLSTKNLSGVQKKKPYDCVIHMIEDSIISHLSRYEILQNGHVMDSGSDFIYSNLSQMNYMANNNNNDGAGHHYIGIGAAKAKLPTDEIRIHLMSLFFQKMDGLKDAEPSDEEVEALAESFGITYDSLCKGVFWPKIKTPCLGYNEPGSIYSWNAIFKDHTVDIEEELSHWYKEMVKRIAAVCADLPGAILCEIENKMKEIYCDSFKGPVYALKLISREMTKEGFEKTLLSIIDTELKKADMQFQDSDYEIEHTAKIQKEIYIEASQGILDRKQKKNIYIAAAIDYYEKCVQKEINRAILDVYKKLKQGIFDLYEKTFKWGKYLYEDICNEVITKDEMLSHLPSDNDSSFDIIELSDLAPGMQTYIDRINTNAIIEKFLREMLDRQEYLIGARGDKEMISQFIKEFCEDTFSDVVEKSLEQFIMREVAIQNGWIMRDENIVDPVAMSIVPFGNALDVITDRLSAIGSPMVSLDPNNTKTIWNPRTQIMKFITVPLDQGCDTIYQLIRTKYANNSSVVVLRGERNDCITVEAFACGLALYQNENFGHCEDVYENYSEGRRIGLFSKQNKENWEELPSPLPSSMWCGKYTAPRVKQHEEEILANFDWAIEKGVIFQHFAYVEAPAGSDLKDKMFYVKKTKPFVKQSFIALHDLDEGKLSREDAKSIVEELSAAQDDGYVKISAEYTGDSETDIEIAKASFARNFPAYTAVKEELLKWKSRQEVLGMIKEKLNV